MEVNLTVEKEALIHQFAMRTGRDSAEIVEAAIDRYLEYNARFRAAVEEGRAAARRGDLLDHEVVVGRIEDMLRS